MSEDLSGKVTILSQQVMDLQARVTELEEILETMLPIIEEFGQAFRANPRKVADFLRREIPPRR